MSSNECHQRAWRQHKEELRNFLAHRSGSAAEADDLLQDVFLRAVLQGADFRITSYNVCYTKLLRQADAQNLSRYPRVHVHPPCAPAGCSLHVDIPSLPPVRNNFV